MFPCTFAFAFAGLLAGLGELVTLVFVLAFVLFALFVPVQANPKMVQANTVIMLKLRFISRSSQVDKIHGGAGATILSRSFRRDQQLRRNKAMNGDEWLCQF